MNQNEQDQVSEINAVPDLQLKVVEMEISTASFPVTWVLSKTWLDENPDIEDWYILFSTFSPTPDGKISEWRGYAKLSEMMAYVVTMRSGHSRVCARLSTSLSTVKDWMRRHNGRWLNQIISFPVYKNEMELANKGQWDCTLDRSIYRADRVQAFVDVDIPKECFAREPSDLEKRWVNWLYMSKTVDQCEFRKRRLFAYNNNIYYFCFGLRYLYV